jgi:hypothetical protein
MDLFKGRLVTLKDKKTEVKRRTMRESYDKLSK